LGQPEPKLKANEPFSDVCEPQGNCNKHSKTQRTYYATEGSFILFNQIWLLPAERYCGSVGIPSVSVVILAVVCEYALPVGDVWARALRTMVTPAF